MGDFPVLVTETLAIRNALQTAIHKRYSIVIIENNSLIAVHGEPRPPGQIYVLVEDIIMLR